MPSSLIAVNDLYIACTFFGFAFCAVPAKWHFALGNTGSLIYMFWAGLGCLNAFTNSLIWRGNALNVAPVWCDISTKFVVGASIGIPAASLCITRRLYKLTTMATVRPTRQEHRNEMLIDCALGFGLPMVIMILHYIVQGHRFDIYEDIGCQPNEVIAWPTIVIVWMPPVIIGCVSGCYGAVTFRHVYKIRKALREIFENDRAATGTGPGTAHYNRLMILACTDACLTVPLATMGIWFAARGGLLPWVNEANTHFDFSRVEQIPAIVWTSVPYQAVALWLSRWSIVLCAFVFFGIFGFAEEAKHNYRLFFWFVLRQCGFKRKFATSRTVGNIPRFASPAQHADVECGGIFGDLVGRDGAVTSRFTVTSIVAPHRSLATNTFPMTPCSDQTNRVTKSFDYESMENMFFKPSDSIVNDTDREGTPAEDDDTIASQVDPDEDYTEVATPISLDIPFVMDSNPGGSSGDITLTVPQPIAEVAPINPTRVVSVAPAPRSPHPPGLNLLPGMRKSRVDHALPPLPTEGQSNQDSQEIRDAPEPSGSQA